MQKIINYQVLMILNIYLKIISKSVKMHNILNGLSGSDYGVAKIPYLYVTFISCKV